MKQTRPHTTTRGFSRASSLMQKRIREATQSRGFSESRLLTHWTEIAGEDIAQMAEPVDVSYARGGMGATLTLLTTGAMAPILAMQTAKLRERVNACYGYNAIARIHITQTAASGFSEGQRLFEHKQHNETDPNPETVGVAQELAAEVENNDLRVALARLGANVLSKRHRDS